MCEPLVMDSRRRRKETSWGARPGAVGEDERIWVMRMGRPVKVASTRRWTRYFEPVNFRGAGAVVAAMLKRRRSDHANNSLL